MSRDRSRLVSPRTVAAVRQRVELAMTSQITILRGDLGVLDPTTGEVGGLENGRTIYTGKARIRTVSGGAVSVEDGYVIVRTTIMSIPIDAPLMPHVDDLVSVVTAPSDLDLNTRIFKITDVQGGSLFGDARRFECQGWTESRYWGQQ